MERYAAIYARKSSDESRESFSLDQQVNRGLQYAYMSGFTVKEDHIIRDNASGMTVDRDGLRKLRGLVKSSAIDAVIVYASDRLSRNPLDAQVLRDELDKHDVALHYVTRGEVQRNAEGELLNGIEDTFNLFWRNRIVERSIEGRKEKAEQRRYLAQGAWDKYGYRRIGTGRHSDIEIHPDEADVIRYVCDQYAQGVKPTAICNVLNTRHVVTPGKSKNFHTIRYNGWSAYMIYDILNESETYTGRFYQMRYKRIGTRRITRPREEWILMEREDLRIISDETFEKIQRIREQNTRYRGGDTKYEILANKRGKCQCGYSVQMQWSNGKPFGYYMCITRVKKEHDACGTPYFRHYEVDNALWAFVRDLLYDTDAIIAGFQQAQEEIDNGHAEAIEHLEAAKAVRQELVEKLDRYADLYAERGIRKEYFFEKKAELEAKIEQADKQIAYYEEQINTVRITDADIADIKRYTAMVRSTLDNQGELTHEEKKELIRRLNVTFTLRLIDGMKAVDVHWYGYDERFWLDDDSQRAPADSRDTAENGDETFSEISGC